MCISWTTKCLISLMHCATMTLVDVQVISIFFQLRFSEFCLDFVIVIFKIIFIFNSVVWFRRIDTRSRDWLATVLFPAPATTMIHLSSVKLPLMNSCSLLLCFIGWTVVYIFNIFYASKYH